MLLLFVVYFLSCCLSLSFVSTWYKACVCPRPLFVSASFSKNTLSVVWPQSNFVFVVVSVPSSSQSSFSHKYSSVFPEASRLLLPFRQYPMVLLQRLNKWEFLFVVLLLLVPFQRCTTILLHAISSTTPNTRRYSSYKIKWSACFVLVVVPYCSKRLSKQSLIVLSSRYTLSHPQATPFSCVYKAYSLLCSLLSTGCLNTKYPSSWRRILSSCCVV